MTEKTEKTYTVTKGNFVYDEEGKKAEGDTVKLAAELAKPLIEAGLIK